MKKYDLLQNLWHNKRVIIFLIESGGFPVEESATKRVQEVDYAEGLYEDTRVHALSRKREF